MFSGGDINDDVHYDMYGGKGDMQFLEWFEDLDDDIYIYIYMMVYT